MKNAIALALAVALLASGCGPDVVENGPRGPQVYRFAVLAAPGVKAPGMPMPGRPGPGRDRRAAEKAAAAGPADFGEAVSAIATEQKLDFVAYFGPVLANADPEPARAALEEFKALTGMIGAPAYAVFAWEDMQGPVPAVEIATALGMPADHAYYHVVPAPGLHVIGLDASEGKIAGAQLQWLEEELKKVPPSDTVVVLAHRRPEQVLPLPLLEAHPGVKVVVHGAEAENAWFSNLSGGKPGEPGLLGVNAPILSGAAEPRYLVLTLEADMARLEVRRLRKPATDGDGAEPTLVPLRKAPKP